MLSQADYAELATFRFQIRSFLSFSEKAALEAGVEPRQHQALLTIKAAEEPCTIGTIAAQLFLQHQSAVGLVNRLESAGLVTRAASKQDGRQVIVRITAQGERILKTLSLTHQSEVQQRAPEFVRTLQAIMRRAKEARQ
jgi:DNA-binding MarR family transcriptional regulator